MILVWLTMDNLHTGQLSRHFFLTSDQPEGENLGPKLHPGSGFFWTMIFYNLKKFTSRSI